MSAIFGWILANPAAATALGAIVADVAIGAIPDKWVGYIGLGRRLINKVADAVNK